jgi:hypothetical protein
MGQIPGRDPKDLQPDPTIRFAAGIVARPHSAGKADNSGAPGIEMLESIDIPPHLPLNGTMRPGGPRPHYAT